MLTNAKYDSKHPHTKVRTGGLQTVSFIHSLPFPSRVGGGTRSVSSMGSTDQLSSWSLPCFPGFMSKRQWAAEGASRGRRAARERIFLRIKSRQKKTEPTDSRGQWTWAIRLTVVDPASLKMITLRPTAKKLLLCFCLFSRGSWSWLFCHEPMKESCLINAWGEALRCAWMESWDELMVQGRYCQTWVQ